MATEEPSGEPDVGSWRSSPGKALAAAVVTATEVLRRSGRGQTASRVVLLLTAVVGLGVAAVLTAVSAEIYDNVTDKEGVAGLDRPALDTAVGWRTSSLDVWVTRVTDIGSTHVLPVIAAGGALAIAWWWRRWTPVLLMAIAAGGSLLLTVVGKLVIGRARPDQKWAVPPYETSPSFPSGHSLNSWVVFGLIAYLVMLKVSSRLIRMLVLSLALLLATAIGLSRVFLGHHWLTDVLVAWALGSAWLVVVITGHRLAVTVSRHGRSENRVSR